MQRQKHTITHTWRQIKKTNVTHSNRNIHSHISPLYPIAVFFRDRRWVIAYLSNLVARPLMGGRDEETKSGNDVKPSDFSWCDIICTYSFPGAFSFKSVVASRRGAGNTYPLRRMGKNLKSSWRWQWLGLFGWNDMLCYCRLFCTSELSWPDFITNSN